MTVSYVAQTRDHLLMLDDDGVCLYVHRRNKGVDDTDEDADGAIACIGAQFVAALDAAEPGFLAHEPRVGVPMLFARVTASGKLCVVRSGPLERFEARGSGFHDSSSLLQDPDGSGSVAVFLPDDCLEDDDQTMRFRRPSREAAPIRVRMVSSHMG